MELVLYKGVVTFLHIFACCQAMLIDRLQWNLVNPDLLGPEFLSAIQGVQRSRAY